MYLTSLLPLLDTSRRLRISLEWKRMSRDIYMLGPWPHSPSGNSASTQHYPFGDGMSHHYLNCPHTRGGLNNGDAIAHALTSRYLSQDSGEVNTRSFTCTDTFVSADSRYHLQRRSRSFTLFSLPKTGDRRVYSSMGKLNTEDSIFADPALWWTLTNRNVGLAKPLVPISNLSLINTALLSFSHINFTNAQRHHNIYLPFSS